MVYIQSPFRDFGNIAFSYTTSKDSRIRIYIADTVSFKDFEISTFIYTTFKDFEIKTFFTTFKDFRNKTFYTTFKDLRNKTLIYSKDFGYMIFIVTTTRSRTSSTLSRTSSATTGCSDSGRGPAVYGFK